MTDTQTIARCWHRQLVTLAVCGLALIGSGTAVGQSPNVPASNAPVQNAPVQNAPPRGTTATVRNAPATTTARSRASAARVARVPQQQQQQQQQQPPQTVDGQTLIRQSAKTLAQLESVQAGMRQRVHLFGNELVGKGKYSQFGSGQQRRLRLELFLRVGEQETRIEQVCDGRFLWTRRTMPENNSLSRVDLRRVRTAMSAGKTSPVTDLTTAWMVLGGLPKLLASLEEHFEFSPAVARQAGEIPVWVLEGRWHKQRLIKMMPEQSQLIESGGQLDYSELPAHLPDRVFVVLRRDQVVPLFPHTVQYTRAETTGGKSTAHPMVTLEFFGVSRQQLDPAEFVFRASETELTNLADHTSAYLASLGLQE